jgi:hypothetical protein
MIEPAQLREQHRCLPTPTNRKEVTLDGVTASVGILSVNRMYVNVGGRVGGRRLCPELHEAAERGDPTIRA